MISSVEKVLNNAVGESVLFAIGASNFQETRYVKVYNYDANFLHDSCWFFFALWLLAENCLFFHFYESATLYLVLLVDQMNY